MAGSSGDESEITIAADTHVPKSKRAARSSSDWIRQKKSTPQKKTTPVHSSSPSTQKMSGKKGGKSMSVPAHAFKPDIRSSVEIPVEARTLTSSLSWCLRLDCPLIRFAFAFQKSLRLTSTTRITMVS